MAGTGLPIPQTGVLAQSPGVIDGDRFSSASAWMQVARAGERIADIGEREQHLILAGKLAEAESDAIRKRADLQAKYAFDPAGFNAAWKGYTDGRLSEMTPGMVPHMRNLLSGQGDAAYASITNQTAARNRGLADDSLIARQKQAEDDVVAVATTDGMGSPKFAAAMTTWDGVAQSRVDGGMVAPDAVKLQRESLFGRATGEAVVIAADRAYEVKGFEGALKETEETLAKSGLRPAEQRKYLDVVAAELRSREVWRKENVRDVVETARPIMEMLDRGVTGLEDEARSVIDRLRELKAPLEATRVERLLAKNAGYLRGMARTGSAPVGGSIIDKIIGVESGGNATAKNPNSSATGAGQFIDSTWLATVRAHRPDLMQGRSAQQVLALRNDPALSREMVGHLARDNAEFLTNSGVRVTDGAIYLAHFAGPRGAVQLLKADPNTPVERVLGADAVAANSFLRGKTAAEVVAWADRKMGDAAAASLDPAMLQGYQQAQQQIFDRRFPDIEKDAAFWGWTPENVSTLESMWPFLTAAQRDRATESMRTGALATAFREQPPEAREALILKWTADAADGDSAARAMLREVEPARRKLAELEGNDPITRGQVGNWGRGPALINWSAPPEQLVGDLRARAQDASVYASRLGRAAVPSLSLGEAANLAGALRTGDANVVARTLGALGATLPQQSFALTMAMPAVKDAVDGLTRSSDPLKMTAVFGALDRMQSSDPVGFGRAFAGDVEKRLALWQSWLAYKSPAELAEAVKAEADPLKAKARAEQRKQAESISEKFSDSQILGMLDPNWLPFNQPAAPTNPDAMARLRVEARLLFGDAFSVTGDESAASTMTGKLLQKVWGASEFAGGALMRRPPEKYYPTIDGSHDWMAGQWNDFVKGRPPGEASAYQLVAARETDSDTSAGKAPRYEVAFQRPDGAWDVLREADGKRVGFQFDEARAEAAQWSQAPGFFGRLQQNLGADWGSGQPKVNILSGEP